MPHAHLKLMKKRGARTRRVGGQPANGNSITHGFYAAVTESLLDQRSRYAKALAATRAGIVEDMGGPEAISAKEWILIERIVSKTAQCALAEAALLTGSSEPASEHYLALSNSLRLDLVAIGLRPRKKAIKNLVEAFAANS